ncbi:MAG TPA: FAD:protein FMN transferase [Vicinamibacteria bacterium]|nr:FAD:protein FMN transferase [Vicinamibacteria bacterium]
MKAGVFRSLLAACTPVRAHRFEGRAMGTTWHVTVVGRPGASDLRERIARRIEEVEQTFSTYRPDSELNRFSRFARAGDEFPASRDFLAVMRTAARVHTLSGGAWDGTLRPLVDFWGFGPQPQGPAPRDPRGVEALLGEVGFDEVEIRDSALVKKRAPLTLDLSSIAKGYGVDQAAEVIRREGFSDFVVEIGGEAYAAGSRRGGGPWRVGIGRPRADSAPDEIDRVVGVQDGALATSGDYRTFFVRDGVRCSHVLDPRTGRPITNGVVSASVLAPDCTLADGLATAAMVMGAEAGVAMLERVPGVEGLVVVDTRDGRLESHPTKGFHSEPVG